jgi:hypothetical protein
MKPVRPHYLDITSVIDREEVASAFGLVRAWEATVTRLRAKEARATDRQTKAHLRLMLLNAENQLRLAKEAEGAKNMDNQETNEQHLLKAVRDHAYANYEVEGWDYLVECWEDDDILDAMGSATTAEEAIKRVRKALRPLNDMRAEVRAAGEW